MKELLSVYRVQQKSNPLLYFAEL